MPVLTSHNFFNGEDVDHFLKLIGKYLISSQIKVLKIAFKLFDKLYIIDLHSLFGGKQHFYFDTNGGGWSILFFTVVSHDDNGVDGVEVEELSKFSIESDLPLRNEIGECNRENSAFQEH